MSAVSLSEVVRILRLCGVDAVVQDTGAGTAALLAGEQPGAGVRWTVRAGPGWFVEAGFPEGEAQPWANLQDLYVGPESDEPTLPSVPVWDLGARTEGHVAALIANAVDNAGEVDREAELGGWYTPRGA